MKRIEAAIRNIENFPIDGIVYKDISPILSDAELFHYTIDKLYEAVKTLKIDYVAAIESRGFLLGTPLALRMGVGFIPIRKAGKLPSSCYTERYTLEYAITEIEVQIDACPAGSKILIVDDVLATGGSAAAAGCLVEHLNSEVVAYLFLMDLKFLDGIAKLGKNKVISLITIE